MFSLVSSLSTYTDRLGVTDGLSRIWYGIFEFSFSGGVPVSLSLDFLTASDIAMAFHRGLSVSFIVVESDFPFSRSYVVS